jgi:hypothetical protein
MNHKDMFHEPGTRVHNRNGVAVVIMKKEVFSAFIDMTETIILIESTLDYPG